MGYKMQRLEKHGCFYVFQPGNGTRYKIFATDTMVENGYDAIVCWLKNGDMGGSAFRFCRYGHISLEYIMEKMNVSNMYDAAAIMLFCKEQFGMELHGIPQEIQTLSWWLNLEAA